MSIELKITDRTNVAFPIVIKDTRGNEIYRQVESGFWWEWTYDDNNNCLTCKDSNGFHYIKGKEVTKREYEAFINNKEKMSNKQSSIEWLIDEFNKIIELHPSQFIKINNAIEQAKEFHEEEIKDAYRFGLDDEYVIGAFNYYNETFGK